MQDGGDGLQESRAEGFYAHGIKSIPSLFTIPPIVPPQPMQEATAIPAKSTATGHHRRQGGETAHQARQHSSTRTAPQTADRKTASASRQQTTSTGTTPDRPAARPTGNKATRPHGKRNGSLIDRRSPYSPPSLGRPAGRRYSRRHPQSLRVRRRKIFLGVYRKFSLPLVRAEKKKGGPKKQRVARGRENFFEK